MLNKHIIGELFEIAQDYKGGVLDFTQDETVKDAFYYKQVTLFAENCRLTICCNKKKEYLIVIDRNNYTSWLHSLSRSQALELLYFLKERYDNCKEYPNAFRNALEQMCYKYEKETEIKKNVK